MRMYDIIKKKRDGGILTNKEIKFIIEGLSNETIPDYQISAILMAIFFRGMNKEETASLTLEMAKSGHIIDIKKIEGIKIDKHSTGGVGDTTTLVLLPLIASTGIPFIKMSGRGLGHTGGTIDKLESISGFKTHIEKEDFITIVNKVKAGIMGQTSNLAPADGKLYALRDVTATVENIPLIASSIMSKKIASGADGIVLDVKLGNGAFMKTLTDARELAQTMVNIGVNLGKKMTALITDMNQPLGRSIGNSLEVKEAILTLKNQGSKNLKEVCIALGAEIMVMANGADSIDSAQDILERNISNGKALAKMKEIVIAQGGKEKVVDNPDLLPISKDIIKFKSNSSGFIESINTEKIGLAAMMLGAGRARKEDYIDPKVGLIMNKKIGDNVEKGETIVKLYTSKDKGIDVSLKLIKEAVKISMQKPQIKPLIYDTIKGGHENG